MSTIIAVILALLALLIRVFIAVPVLFWAIGQWLDFFEKVRNKS